MISANINSATIIISKANNEMYKNNAQSLSNKLQRLTIVSPYLKSTAQHQHISLILLSTSYTNYSNVHKLNSAYASKAQTHSVTQLLYWLVNTGNRGATSLNVTRHPYWQCRRNPQAATSVVVPQGSLEAQFSLPRPRLRTLCLGLGLGLE